MRVLLGGSSKSLMMYLIICTGSFMRVLADLSLHFSFLHLTSTRFVHSTCAIPFFPGVEFGEEPNLTVSIASLIGESLHMFRSETHLLIYVGGLLGSVDATVMLSINVGV